MAALLAVTSWTAGAQKYDRENLEFNNTHLPSKLIYDQIKTYGVNVQVYGSDPAQLSGPQVAGWSYAFQSFDRVDPMSADMRINYTVGPFSYVGEKTISRTVDEEQNKVKVRVTKYKRVYEYRYPVRVEVLNTKNGVRMYFNEYSSQNIRSIEGYEFNSESEAVNYFEKNKLETLKSQIAGHVSSFVKGVNSTLADQYDFFPASNVLNVFQFKKWDKDDEYNAHVTHVKSVMKTMTAGEGPDFIREKLKADLDYFHSFEGVFKADDKKEDILYFGNYMNLATLYFCMDDMDKAEFYLGKLDSVDKKEGMTNVLKSYIRSARTRMAKHLLATTHLDYNPVKDYRLAGKTFSSDALSAAENVINGMGAEGLAKANDQVQFTNGTTARGKVIWYAESQSLKLIPADKPEQPMLLNADNVVSFNMDTLRYVAAKVRYGTVMKKFFAVKYASEKIQLLCELTPQFTEGAIFSMIRPNEELVTIIGGFGMKKELGKYFEDCADVAAKAKDGDYGKALTADARKYVQMCEEYTNCGKTAVK
jgi:hypothetical protein